MGAPEQADDFLPAALSSLGIEADEVEMAVIGAAHQLLGPAIGKLLAFDTSDVQPEQRPDLSKGPA